MAMDIDHHTIKEPARIIESFKEIKPACIFGSHARGSISPLSDYDFALYLDTTDKKLIYDIKFELCDRLARLLKTDKVDSYIKPDRVAGTEIYNY